MMIKQSLTYALLAILALAACRKEEAKEPIQPQPTPPSTTPTIPSGGDTPRLITQRLSLTTYADELSTLRGVDFVQSERGGGKDGEVLPRLKLQVGSKELVYLILVKEGDQASMHRQVLYFTVLSPDDERASGKQNVLHYDGDVTLPQGYKLSEGKWYAMAILNMDLYNAEDKPTKTVGEDGAMVAFGRRNRFVAGSTRRPDTGDHALIMHHDDALQPQTYNVKSVPYLSQWQEITASTIEGNATSTATPSYRFEGLRLKPQGLLLHYELGIDVLNPMHIRSYGLCSNALSFSGYYDLDTEHLYNKFASRDRSSNIAYPDWQSDPMLEQALSEYYSAGHSSLSTLADTERPFPWDLPSISNDVSPSVGAQTYLTKQALSANFSTKSILPKAVDGVWRFWQMGKDYHSRRSLLFWAMPIKQKPSKPFTYLWAGVYSNQTSEDKYTANDFIPQERIGKQLVDKLERYREELRQLEHKIEIQRQYNSQDISKLEAELAGLKAKYKAEFDRYTADSTTYYTKHKTAFLSQTTARTQPMLVLHQSSQTFEDSSRQGKVHHIRTLLSSELMLTELLRHEENGRNYSVVELHNPTTKPVDLAQYALVRLCKQGNTKYSFRKGDGSLTDNLAECVSGNGLLELKKILRQHVLVGEGYSDRFYSINRGLFEGEKWYTDLWAEREDEEHTLLPDQCVLIGAKDYQTIKSSTSQPAWWVALDQRLQRLSKQGADALRAMVYAPSGDVLQLATGEGIALIRKYGNKWQVVDATAPISGDWVAYAGTYAGHSQQIASLGSTYSQRRIDGVNFPFIAPYCTYRKGNNAWAEDWQATRDWATHTLGLRTSDRSAYDASNGHLQVYYPTWYLSRTPYDEGYSTYWTNRPHGGSSKPAYSPKSTAKPSPGKAPTATPPNSARPEIQPTPTPIISKPSVSASAYSASARANQTWWVKGVNTHAPAVKDWKCAWGKVKALEWKKEYGWYDLNKTNPQARGKDSDLCWAAASSNMLQWWLDQNADLLQRYGRYNGPKTFTDSFTSAIFDHYKKHFGNKGGDFKAELDWFFNGKHNHRDYPGGGFFVDVFGADFHPVVAVGAHESNFSDDIAKALKLGEAIGCSLKLSNQGEHALTIWGADFDAQGRVTHIYLTDSNDKALMDSDVPKINTKAGLLRKAIKMKNGRAYVESSAENVFVDYVITLYTLSLYRDRWEAYLSRRR